MEPFSAYFFIILVHPNQPEPEHIFVVDLFLAIYSKVENVLNFITRILEMVKQKRLPAYQFELGAHTPVRPPQTRLKAN